MANNPEARVTVKMFADDFKKGAAELKNETNTLNREFKLQQEQMRLTATETEKLEAKITYLSQKQDIARRSVEQSQLAYEEAVRLFGENSQAAQNMARNLDNARIDEQRLSNEIEIANRALQNQSSEVEETAAEIEDLGATLESTGQRAKDFGDNLTDAGSKMTVGVTAPIVAAGGAAIASAIQFENASARIQNALGITADEAEALSDSAKNIWKEGFGESLDEVTEALVRVKQNMKDIGDSEELERVTRDTILLAKTFDADLNEVTRAGNNLMHNFGVTSEEAFDLMAYGAQNGLNFSNELFDNVAEYSGLFSTLGFEAEEYFQILQKGSESGIYNLDYLNDVIKEFGIRIKDGSKATGEALSYLFRSDEFDNFMINLQNGGTKTKEFMELVAREGQKDAEQLVKDLEKGGAAGVKAYDYLEYQMGKSGELIQGLSDGSIRGADAMQTILEKIKEIDDPMTRAQIGVSLFGTKWEDLEEDAMFSLIGINGEIENLEGTMEGIADAQEQTFGQRFQAIFRQAQAALLPLGTILLDMAEQWLPKISAAIQSMVTWFTNLSPAIQNLIVILAGVAAVIGPILVVIGTMVSAFGSIAMAVGKVISILSKLGPIFNAIKLGIAVMSGPIALVVAIVVGLAVVIFRNWDAIKNKTVEIFNSVKNYLTTTWTSIKAFLSVLFAAISAVAKTVFNGLKAYFTTVFNFYKTIITGVWNAIKSFITTTFNAIKSVATSVWNGIKSTITNVTNGIKTSITGAWDSIKSTTTSVWNGIKNAITNPIETAKKTLLGIIDTIKSAFSKMKITIPKPKLPKIDISMGKKTIAGVEVPYPKFDISWFKTGGVFTRPVVAGNAGFGDVAEAIVPFEGSHAARIAGLIAVQQKKLESASNTISTQQSIYIRVVSELDGQEVANNQYQYLDGMTTSNYNMTKVVKGY